MDEEERIEVVVEEVSPGVQTYTFATPVEPGVYVFEPYGDGFRLRRTGEAP